MQLHPRLLVVGAACALALTLTPTSAFAHDDDGHGDDGGKGDLLRSGLVGSTRSADGGADIFTVKPGGAPWVVDEGTVRVRRDGRLDVRIEGLVIPTPPQNGTNPVAAVTATLYCNAKAAAVTKPFPLSRPEGDGRIRADLMLPMTCVAPVVLLNPVNADFPNGNPGTYIAATG
jgi:hypothetical protein